MTEFVLYFIKTLLSLCAILSFICFIFPGSFVGFVVKWYKLDLKLLALEGDVRPTEKTKNMIRLWSFFAFLICVLLILLPKTFK